MKILVVDDDPEIQQWLESNLSREGFELTVYADGLSALDMFDAVEPELVLADSNLSGMNIVRFCTKLKQRSGDKNIPVFLLVAPGSELDEPRLRSAGVSEFLSVPLNLQDVMAKIRPAAPGVKPAEAASEAAPPEAGPLASESSVEGMKIEELLGWTSGGQESGDIREAAPPPRTASAPSAAEPAVEDERTVIADFSGKKAGWESPPETGETGDQTVVMRPADMVPPSPAFQSTPEPAKMESTGETAGDSLVSGSLAEQMGQMGSTPGEGESPATAGASPGAAGPDAGAVQDAVTQTAREVIEKIAWEVVPAIAEALIKEELEKLKPKKQD